VTNIFSYRIKRVNGVNPVIPVQKGSILFLPCVGFGSKKIQLHNDSSFGYKERKTGAEGFFPQGGAGHAPYLGSGVLKQITDTYSRQRG